MVKFAAAVAAAVGPCLSLVVQGNVPRDKDDEGGWGLVGFGLSPASDEATLSRRSSPRISDDSRTLPQPLLRISASRSAGVWNFLTKVS